MIVDHAFFFVIFELLKKKISKTPKVFCTILLFIIVQKLILAHCPTILEVVIDNVGSCLWQIVGRIMVASWNEEHETYVNLI
jgi:hypothetical protein